MTPFVDLSDPAATRPLGGKADSLRRLARMMRMS